MLNLSRFSQALLFLFLSVFHLPVAEAADWSWTETEGKSLALNGKDGLVWRLNYGDEYPHFHFDHLSPSGGANTAWASPSDHVWHYGLWFSWKFINQVNYWEIPGNGDGYPKGRTVIDKVDVLERSDDGAKIQIHQDLHPAGSEQRIASERVDLSIETPRSDGSYVIDWRLECTAMADLKFSSSGKGYGGLSLRASPDWAAPEYLASDGDRTDFTAELRRVKSQASWMDLSGQSGRQIAGVTFFDHPSNLRFPNKWYSINSILENKQAGTKWPMYYNNASIFADGPLSLLKGETLVLNYRVYVHKGRGDVERLRAVFEQFKSKER